MAPIPIMGEDADRQARIEMEKYLYYVLVVLLSVAISCSGRETETVKYDYVIKNGTVVDGSGKPRYKADIGIGGERIVKIGTIPEEHGTTVIDASGKIVSPGFIDIHTHADNRILEDTGAHNFIMQGVTTVVGGNCGGSKLNLEEFFGQLESNGIALNIGMLVGHNSVRSKVMGNEGRDPSESELDEMKKIVEREMKAGALGISTGLKYRPGVYSKTDEVVALAGVAAHYGGFYATHLRDEGLKLLESIEEALEICEKANIPLQLSHHKAVGADMWGKTEASLKLIEDARTKGLDVTADQYAYTATFTGIAIIFPEWALEGNKSDIEQRLNDPETRKRVREGIIFNIKHDRGGNDIKNITIAVYPEDTRFEGKNLEEILALRDMKPTMENAAELVIDLYEHGPARAVYHCLSEEDVVRTMKHPLVMHASDADISQYKKGSTHPRHYGNFPRVLGHYVRDKGILTLEEAIRKTTSFPASRIGTHERGRLAENTCGDIVIFDPLTIRDTATWSDPHQYPEGIEYVFVNGAIVVSQGNITGELPGKIIYGPGRKP